MFRRSDVKSADLPRLRVMVAQRFYGLEFTPDGRLYRSRSSKGDWIAVDSKTDPLPNWTANRSDAQKLVKRWLDAAPTRERNEFLSALNCVDVNKLSDLEWCEHVCRSALLSVCVDA